MNPLRNIIRLDRTKVSGGYLVRLARRGKRIEKWFVDEDFGGKRKSLLAAKEFRDQMEAKYPAFSSQDLARKNRANNKSGVTGVRLVSESDPRWPSKPTYRYWVAQWSPKPGVRKTARFSVAKYGEAEAYKLAVQARKRGVAAMEA